MSYALCIGNEIPDGGGRRLEEEEREQLLGQQTGSSSAAREGPPDVQAKGADAAERQRDPDIV